MSGKLNNIRELNGAPGRNNLEPSECDLILTELENWTSILEAEPEIIHRLAAFADAASADADGHELSATATDPPELAP